MNKVFTVLVLAMSGGTLSAQFTVDIGLFPSQLNDTTLEVYLRPTADYGDVAPWFTFTIQWPATSVDTLRTRVNACPSGVPVSAVAMVTSGGYHHRTYNAFSTTLLDDEGCPWTANQEHLIVSIPVYPHFDPLEQFCISDFDVGINTGIIYSDPCLNTGLAAGPSAETDVLSVSPVPVVDDLVISLNGRTSVPSQPAVFGMDGRPHALRPTATGRWDASTLTPGVYILRTEVGTARFVKL